VNDILAKLSAREKLMGLGSIGVVVGWLVGMILGSAQQCENLPYVGKICSGNINYFTWGNAGIMAILALVAAVILLVVLYLKNSSTAITWPMPVSQILLGLAVIALVLAALTVLIQFSNGTDGAPVLMWVADVILVGGAAVAAWGAYQEWAASKK
jgi:hypothetical protein